MKTAINLKESLQHVDSSQLQAVAYDLAEGVLLIEFKGGAQYYYVGVNAFTYDSMVNSESVGSFFTKYIKNDPTIKVIKI